MPVVQQLQRKLVRTDTGPGTGPLQLERTFVRTDNPPETTAKTNWNQGEALNATVAQMRQSSGYLAETHPDGIPR